MCAFRSVVVGVDGSGSSRRALEWTAAQAGIDHVLVVHAFSVGLELFAGAAQINLDPARAQHARLLETDWSEPGRHSDADVQTSLIDDDPSGALLFAAVREHADAVVIGDRGHGRWSRHHVGDVAGRLLHRCDVPLILTSETTEPVRLDGTVVVGLSRPTTDDNPELVWALERVVELGLAVHLVHVTERPAYIDGDLAFATTAVHTGLLRELTELTDRLRGAHGSIEVTSAVLEGDPSDAIAAEAAEVGACLVVVGAHHHGVIGDFVAGSVARTLAPMLDCPLAAIPVRSE